TAETRSSNMPLSRLGSSERLVDTAGAHRDIAARASAKNSCFRMIGIPRRFRIRWTSAQSAQDGDWVRLAIPPAPDRKKSPVFATGPERAAYTENRNRAVPKAIGGCTFPSGFIRRPAPTLYGKRDDVSPTGPVINAGQATRHSSPEKDLHHENQTTYASTAAG